MDIPFVDLKAQYAKHKVGIDKAIHNVIGETAFIGGRFCSMFESAFSEYTGMANTIGCANGTDAIELVLDSLHIATGDEIIVPALSWVSTAEAVSSRGAKPVFVDIDDSFTIDVDLIEEKISKRTRGIIPVHLYGRPANMPAIMKIAEAFDLFVIEDCAQAHGAKIAGQHVGSFGIAGTFSFYPGKNLGAYGDAGAVVTNHEGTADLVRQLSNHGQPKKHIHSHVGRNSRLDGLQAAILLAKLPYLNEWVEKRNAVAVKYSSELSGIDNLTLPDTPQDMTHAFHLYVIRHGNRDELSTELKDCGVSTAIHYPQPMPLMPCFSNLNHTPKDFPVATRLCSEILSLPIYPEISEAAVQYVSSCIRNHA